MKPIGACIFVVSFLMIFASLVRFYVFVMPPGGSKMLAGDVSIGPYQGLGRSPSHHEVLSPVQLRLRLQNHHHHTQVATTMTPQTSLAMDQEVKKQVQSIIDQLKGHPLPDGGEIVGSINSSSREFNATNNRAHIVRQYESGSTASERKTTRETPDRKERTFSSFSLEDLRQYFVRELIKAVSVGILLAIFLFCSKVSLRLLVRSSTQTSASQQVEIVERIPLSLSDPAATIPLSLSDPAATIRIRTGFCYGSRRIRLPRVAAPLSGAPPKKVPEKRKLAKGEGRVTLENLQQYFGHNRKDVAASLGVSVSTFKRMCRRQGIMQWQNRIGSSGSVSKTPDQHGEKNTSTACRTPSRNVENGLEVEPVGQLDSFEDLNFWNTEIGSIAEIPSDWDFSALEEEPSLEGLVSGSVNLTVAACSDPDPCQHPVPTIPDTMTMTHMMPHLTAKGDMRFVTLKVTYGKKIIKFQFPLTSGIIELKEEVKKRLKLELGSFDVEYKDEDGDCIFLGCDEDLRNHLQLFSNQVIRLFVVDSDANTANFR